MRVILALALIAPAIATARAQDVAAGPSAEGAYRTSLWGTVVPVTAGAAILVAQGSGEHDRTAPLLLLWGGSLFGPSFGYTQAGLGGRGWRGVGIRAGLELATLTAAIAVCGMQCTNDQEDAANIIGIAGIGLVTVSAVYDIAHVRRNVREHAARTRRLGFAPFYSANRRTIGLRGSIAF